MLVNDIKWVRVAMSEYMNRLKKLVKEASRMLEQSKIELASDPRDFALKLTVTTFEAQVKDLENQYVAYQVFEKGFSQLLRKDNLVEARNNLLKAIEMMPSYLGYLNNQLVNNFYSTQNWSEAIDAFHFVMDLNPGYEVVRNNLAMIFINYAVEILKKEQLLNEHIFIQVIDYLSRALTISSSKEVSELAKNNLAATYTLYGKWLYEKGFLELALVNMQLAFSYRIDRCTKVNIGKCFAALARVSLEKGDFNVAASWFQRSEESGFVLPEILNDHGIALAKIGYFDQAVIKFESALKLDPASDLTRHNLKRVTEQNTKLQIALVNKPSVEEIEMNWQTKPFLAEAA
ncbi:MAG: hypothetical protein FD167_553 [bacterium]|nr:MAG: hypothetical protein FD167_553 [bacterium]